MHFAIDTFSMERFGLVTGSKCSVLFPDRGDGKKGQRTYAKQLANQMFFQTYDEYSTWQTEHGKMCEGFAREFYADHYNKNITGEGRWIRSQECGGTIDDEVKMSHGIDYKCPTSLNKWLDYLHEPLDKDQIHQCQMYCHLTGYSYWEIAAYLEETQFMSENGLTYPVPRHQRMIIVRVDRDPTWSERLVEPLEYVVGERNTFLEKLKTFFNGATL